MGYCAACLQMGWGGACSGGKKSNESVEQHGVSCWKLLDWMVVLQCLECKSPALI